ncbi:MAG: Gfo/Idh/MocA family oxidoreductase [Oceanicaulis sp.]
MPDPVRWGVLGAARIAKEQMGPAINAAQGGVLSAVATRSPPDKAALLARIAPGARVLQDYDALLDDPEIDAIYIPLPNHLHVEWAIRAARAGKHVLCEKPMALETGAIDALINVRDETGVEIAEAFMIAHHPQWACARELVNGGRLGALHRLEASFTAPLTDMSDFRNNPPGGGALRDLGGYVLGAARLATGEEPEDGVAARIDWEAGVDATVQVTARFPSFLFNGHVSMRAALWQDLSIHGADASVRLPIPFNPLGLGEAHVELHRQTQMQVWRFPETNQYVRQVEAFNTAVRGSASFPHPLEASRAIQAFVDTAYQAGGSAGP